MYAKSSHRETLLIDSTLSRPSSGMWRPGREGLREGRSEMTLSLESRTANPERLETEEAEAGRGTVIGSRSLISVVSTSGPATTSCNGKGVIVGGESGRGTNLESR